MMKMQKRGLAAVLCAGLILMGCAGEEAELRRQGDLGATESTGNVQAVQPENTAVPTHTPEPAPIVLEEAVTSFPQYLDLDGDGDKELIEFIYPEPEEPAEGEGEAPEDGEAPEEEEQKLILRITRGDTSWQGEVPLGENPRLFASDMDMDGQEELLLEVQTGETIFWVHGWRFTGEELLPLTFEEEQGFCGRVESLHGRRLVLHRWMDLLGTYELERDYRLIGDKFMPDEEMWQVLGEETDFPLTVLQDVFAMSDGEEEEGTEILLYRGLCLRLTATDLQGQIWFKTETGDIGYLPMEQDEEGRFTRFGGLEENELFSGMPYAG